MRLSIVLIILLVINNYSKSKDDINKVIIKYASYNIESPFSINCISFEEYFKEDIKTIIINDSNEINKIRKSLTKLTKDDKELLTPDVRVKIEIIRNNGDVDIVCMDNLRISFNNIPMNYSKEFRNTIDLIIKKHKTFRH